MGKAMFYHLTRSSVEATLLTLLPRALAQGWRVQVRGRDPAALALLDEALWSVPPDGFLPHGMEGGPDDARQPVLLGQGGLGQGGLRPGTRALALVGGATANPAEAATLERLWVIFDSGDMAEMDAARSLWREITGAGLAAEYWSEETGRWMMKMEKAATTGA